MKDRFQFLERIGISKHLCTKRLTIDGAVLDRSGKRGIDGGHRRAAGSDEIVHDGVRVADDNTKPAKHIGGRTLPHADRTGQTEDDHARRSSRIWSRRPWVTVGSCPNHAVNPGRA